MLGIAGTVGVAEALQQIMVEAGAVGCVDPAQHVGVAAADTGDQVRGGGDDIVNSKRCANGES